MNTSKECSINYRWLKCILFLDFVVICKMQVLGVSIMNHYSLTPFNRHTALSSVYLRFLVFFSMP